MANQICMQHSIELQCNFTAQLVLIISLFASGCLRLIF